MDAGMVLAVVGIQRQILPHKSHGGIQRLLSPGLVRTLFENVFIVGNLMLTNNK